MIKRLLLIAATLVTMITPAAITAPASAAACHVSTWHTRYAWSAHRTSGTCRIEAWARDANGRGIRGADKTTGTSVAWDNVRLVAGGWTYS